MQYVLDLDLEFVIWNWGLILLILGLMRWCAGIIFNFCFWVPRVVSCGGELRRIFYCFCFIFWIPSSPEILRVDFWIRSVFELWRDYFRGWILDMIFVFEFSDPQFLSLFFLINPGSSSFVSGSLGSSSFFFYPQIPRSLGVFQF